MSYYLEDTKRSRCKGETTTLIEYLYSLKSRHLNSTHPLPPDIEDAIKCQLSNLPHEDLEQLLKNFIYPGVSILKKYPNALIGDAILHIISTKTLKTILLSTKADFQKFECILNINEWEGLDPRAICLRIAIVSSLVESGAFLDKILPNIKELLIIIFKGFQNGTYFVQLSAAKFISSIIELDSFNYFFRERFFLFQDELIQCLGFPICEATLNKLQLYKCILSDKRSIKFLFISRNHSKNLGNSFGHVSDINSLAFDKINHILNLLISHENVLISNLGIEIFRILLMDDQHLFSSGLRNFITELLGSTKTYISATRTFFSRPIERLSVNLKLISTILESNICSYLVNLDFMSLLLNLMNTIITSTKVPDFFATSGIFLLLLKVTSSFKTFSGKRDDYELTHSELNLRLKYVSLCFSTNRLLLINLTRISTTFQIMEPQLINYSNKILSNNIEGYELSSVVPVEYFTLFMEDLFYIYYESQQTNWQLYLFLKYLQTLYITKVIRSLTEAAHLRTIKIISEIMFIDFDIESSPYSKIELRKFSLLGPNVTLLCSDILGKVLKSSSSNSKAFKQGFSLVEGLIKICLSFKSTNTTFKRELYYDDYSDFLIKIVSIIKDIEIPNSSYLFQNEEILTTIYEFSKNGLSPEILNSIFYLIEGYLRGDPEFVKTETVEEVVRELLLYYIPGEEQDGYLTLFNRYKNICNSIGKLECIPHPCRINEDFVSHNYTKQYRYLVNDPSNFDEIVSKFTECNLDCIGE
ncbi:hypothetical protein HWI79_2798 [Cryptosporidium felis]|nr:hypothetical protein HWI79_2798 [Cryptosporidium felis]